MSAKEMEKRIEALEREIAEIKRLLGKEKVEKEPWYIRNAGMFKDDPVFDAIVEEGRKYRDFLRPKSRNRKSKKSE